MKEYKDNFKNAISYAVHKLGNPALKMILLGMLGSIYVGIAYLVFIIILGSWPGVITKEIIETNTDTIVLSQHFNISIPGTALFTAAALFPVGIILILFLGGSLFTSDNLTMLAWITKQKDHHGNQVKLSRIIVKWAYTLLGNLLGGIVFGAITRGADFFANENYQLTLGYLCGKKLSMAWYYTIFSGFLCNILVAGSVWATFAAKHSTAKIFLIYFPIWLFAISGFQHVVANCILFSMGLFYMIDPTEQANLLLGINFSVNHNAFEELATPTIENFKQINGWVDVSEFIFRSVFMNLIPAAIGNWMSGSLFLPYTYYYLSGYSKELKNNIHNVM